MAGGDRETAIGLMMFDSELYSWRRDHPHVDHVTPNRLQRSVHDGLEHWSRNPAVAAHDDACFSTGARKSPGAEANRGDIQIRISERAGVHHSLAKAMIQMAESIILIEGDRNP